MFLGLMVMALSLAGPAPVIDGRFDDWADAAEIAEPWQDAPAAVDLGPLHWRHDGDGLWLSLQTAQAGNLVSADRTLSLLIDNAAGGAVVGGLAGVDQVVAFAPVRREQPSRLGARASVYDGTDWQHAGVHTVGLSSAPTAAGKRFEMLLRNLDLPPASRLAMMLGNATESDRSPMFVVPAGAAAASRPEVQVGRPAGEVLRILSWNVGDYGVMRDGSVLQRLVSAADPDVVLLDEVPPAADAQWIAGWLPGAGWFVHQGSSGGRQRQIIAARVPVQPLVAFAQVPLPAPVVARIASEGSATMQREIKKPGGTTVPVSAATLNFNGQSLLLVSVDLQCCGRLGSIHDRVREHQVRLLVPLIKRALEAEPARQVVVAGDLNLVGGRGPLGQLEDLGLVAVHALQPDGLDNTTWSNPRDIFPPGRLDYVLHSAGLTVHSAAVFNPARMSQAQHQSVGIEADVLDGLDDHQPLVVNFVLPGRGADGENTPAGDR